MNFPILYQFYDRDMVMPILAMKWPDYIRKFGKGYDWEPQTLESDSEDGDRLSFLEEVEEDDAEPLRKMLQGHTVGWGLGHRPAQEAYQYLSEVMSLVPAFCVRCPDIGEEFMDETIILRAAAVDAVLRGRIKPAWLRPLCSVCWRYEECDTHLDLTRPEKARLKELFHGQTAVLPLPRPSLPQLRQSSDAYCEFGSGQFVWWLTEAQTRLFMRVIELAVTENWQAPRISQEYRECLKLGKRTPRVNDFVLAKDFVDCWRKGRYVHPFLAAYWYGY